MDGQNPVFAEIQFRRLEISVKSARMSCLVSIVSSQKVI